MLIYTHEHEKNKGIKKQFEIKTPYEFKLRYGNSYVHLESPRYLQFLIAEDYNYDLDNDVFELTLSSYRNIGLIDFINNYHLKFTALEGFDTLDAEFKLINTHQCTRFYTKKEIIGDKTIFTMSNLAMDVLNIVKNHGINGGW